MKALYRWLSRAPNYIKTFGLRDGLRLLWQVGRPLAAESRMTERVDVPGYEFPIHMRRTLSDRSIFWQCIVQRQYDVDRFPQTERLRAAYQQSLERGERPLIVDCGANVGFSALFLANLFPKAVIYAIEPNKENYELLALNVKPFGARVVPLQGGIWHESGLLRIVNPESGSASFRVEADGVDQTDSDESLRAYTIAEICALAGVESPLIAKVDIEGAQASLFRDSVQWVGGVHLIMLELEDWLMPWQGTSRAFFSCVSQYPFDYLIRGENIFCYRDFMPKPGK